MAAQRSVFDGTFNLFASATLHWVIGLNQTLNLAFANRVQLRKLRDE